MPVGRTSSPAGTPRVPGRIIEGMREAIADPRRRPRAYIRLSAHGGVRGEAYDFEYVIDALGHTTSRLTDELSGEQHVSRDDPSRPGDPGRFALLAEAVDLVSLMQVEQQTGGFVPDSVVGRLEVSDGEQSVSFLFPAGDSLAARAQADIPDRLRHAVEVVYQAAEASFGNDEPRRNE